MFVSCAEWARVLFRRAMICKSVRFELAKRTQTWFYSWMRSFPLLTMLVLISTRAMADYIPPCSPPAGVIVFTNLKNISKPLAEVLDHDFGYIAAPGEDFDATDVATTGHFIRLIFVWKRGDTWIVALERGGIGYNDPIRKYLAQRDKVKLVTEELAIPDTVCSVARTVIKK